MAEETLSFDDNHSVRALVGELSANLGAVHEVLGVAIDQRGTQLRVSGEAAPVALAAMVLEQLYGVVRDGTPLSPREVAQATRVLARDPSVDLRKLFSERIVVGKGQITPRTPNQRDYVHAMRRNPVVFGVGPAGTGKTFLAVAMAVEALLRGDVKRVVLTRPAVEAGERLGFLPGDLHEKVDPYLRPLFDAMSEMVPGDRISRMMERQVIEVAPLAFMRGRTLSNAWVILDEAQNTTVGQMKMFLTRIGNGAHATITGDDTQVDLPSGQRSGLRHALRILEGIDGLELCRLTRDDVVRHQLVAEIIDAYERDAMAGRR